MASGSQDWVRRTDIYVQSLSEITQRFVLGFSQAFSFQGNLIPNSDNKLIEIYGSGNVIGSVGYVQDNAIINNDYLTVVVDGQVIPDALLSVHRIYAPIISPHAIWNYVCIDDVNFRYAWALGIALSFKQSLVAYFYEGEGRSPVVRADIVVGLF